MAIPPWKLDLRPASYNGIPFHVEVHGRQGGRRKHLHEFPKKSTPYLEDMGRRARRFTVSAYVIGPDFEAERDALIEQLDAEGNGQLVHPTFKDVDTVGVELYSITERREQGGFAVFDITFIEAGQDISQGAQADTQGAVTGSVDGSVPQAGDPTGGVIVTDFSGSSDITGLA